ncbi:MAG: metallophosphoesterase [Nitrospirae bacterium]|nr:MAG: metallophosphoesterase [Nitrospirota bacterium]
MLLGVISDTHDQLPEAVARLFAGVDGILHAGDICSQGVLDRLAAIAPTTAVRGNNDWHLPHLPEVASLEVAGHRLWMIHNLAELHAEPAAAGVSCVVCGHTHRPLNERRGSILYFNPGAVGPRRGGRPRSVGLLHLENGTVRGEILPFTAPGDP